MGRSFDIYLGLAEGAAEPDLLSSSPRCLLGHVRVPPSSAAWECSCVRFAQSGTSTGASEREER